MTIRASTFPSGHKPGTISRDLHAADALLATRREV